VPDDASSDPKNADHQGKDMALGIGARLDLPLSSFRARASGAWRATVTAFILVISANSIHAAPAHYQVLTPFPATTVLGDDRVGAPTHGFVVAPDGTMYGLGALGFGGQTYGGALYTVSSSGIYAETYRFGVYDGYANGANRDVYMPSMGMLNDGSLYGITYGGGPSSDSVQSLPMGTVFNYSAAGQFTTLHTFYGPSANDGANPMGIVLGQDGNYYGITSKGGPSNNPENSGVVFQLTPGGQETILYTFLTTSGGSAPTSFLMGKDGNIYGLLPSGAPLDSGTILQGDAIFRLTINGVLTILYQFNPATDGRGAHNLIQTDDGNFYGTAAAGGLNDAGTVFEFSSSNHFSVLHAFDNSSKQEGFSPGPLVMGTDGNLYGAASYGSRSGAGTVFRLSPDGVFTILHTFDGFKEGSAPLTITQHGARSFYGTAGGSTLFDGPSGVFKLVVPIRDDLNAVGRASILTSGQNSFTTAAISTVGTSQAVTTAVASGYYPAAIGDFNGDGVADIVWTSANNDIYTWFGGAAGYTPKYVGNYPAGWRMVGAGDINGDGMDDLIWLDSQTNQFAYWLMDGKTRTGYRIFNITPGYYPATIGDFDNDGKADVVWTSANNDLYFWLSNGSGFTGRYITTYPAGWQVIGRGDLDGDGRDDLIWDTKDGTRWGYWLMNGTAIEKIVAMSVPASLSGYNIAATSDYNGDGISDILWSNGSQIVLGSNQGQCSITVTCTFSMSTSPVSLPAGQKVFNSGIPLSATP